MENERKGMGDLTRDEDERRRRVIEVVEVRNVRLNCRNGR